MCTACVKESVAKWRPVPRFITSIPNRQTLSQTTELYSEWSSVSDFLNLLCWNAAVTLRFN